MSRLWGVRGSLTPIAMTCGMCLYTACTGPTDNAGPREGGQPPATQESVDKDVWEEYPSPARLAELRRKAIDAAWPRLEGGRIYNVFYWRKSDKVIKFLITPRDAGFDEGVDIYIDWRKGAILR